MSVNSVPNWQVPVDLAISARMHKSSDVNIMFANIAGYAVKIQADIDIIKTTIVKDKD